MTGNDEEGDYTYTIYTDFPDWERGRLEKEAVLRHELRGYDVDDAVQAGVDRVVVNMLRHQYTTYDRLQDQESHRLVCEAIAKRYPWLGNECQRQIEARAQAEEEDAAFREWAQLEARLNREEARREHQQLVTESKEAIKKLKVGMTVRMKIKGHIRTGVITKVARTRVTFTYHLKSGAERRALVHASELEIVEG